MLTPIFASFCAACPDIRLDVIVANQVLNLSKRDADVAIRATLKPPETLVGRRIASMGWGRYAPKSWIVRGRGMAVTAVTPVSQWAETHRIALGLGSPAPTARQPSLMAFGTKAAMGLP